MNIFPIKISAYETRTYTSSPYQYRGEFLKAFRDDHERPRTWYAFDVTIHSRTVVSFVAYDMRDTCYGGIGDKIWSGGPFDIGEDVTSEDVERAILHAAIDRRQAELAAAEAATIARYADEIRSQFPAAEKVLSK